MGDKYHHSVTSCHLSSRRGFLLEGGCRETTGGVVSKIRIKGRPMIAPTEKVGDGASTSCKTVDKCCDKRYCRHN